MSRLFLLITRSIAWGSFLLASISVLLRNLHFLLKEGFPGEKIIGTVMGETVWFYVAFLTSPGSINQIVNVLGKGGVLLGLLWIFLKLRKKKVDFLNQAFFLFLLFLSPFFHILWDINPDLFLSFTLFYFGITTTGNLFLFKKTAPLGLRVLSGSALFFLFLLLGFWITDSLYEKIALFIGGAVTFLPGARAFFFHNTEKWVGIYIIAGISLNIFPGVTPLPIQNGAQEIGKEQAYLFCELPQKKKVFAGVPHCEGSEPHLCKQGEILEYDSLTGRLEGRRTVFSDDFWGRIVYLLCLDSPPWILISLSSSPFAYREESLMIYNYLERKVVTRKAVPIGGGRVLYEKKKNRIFTGSEKATESYTLSLPTTFSSFLTFPTNPSLFVDFTPFQFLRTPLPSLLKTINPAPGYLEYSYLTEKSGIDEKKPSGFWGQYVGGQGVVELYLDDPQKYQLHPFFNGGIHSLTIDPRYNRLIVSGFWGIEVKDLTQNRIVGRFRTELGPRYPILSEKHNLVLIPCTYGSHLWVFQRSDFQFLGKVFIGSGARYGLLTEEEDFFWISTREGQFRIPVMAILSTLKRSPKLTPNPPP